MPATRPIAIRVVALLVALAACVWFVLSTRQAHDTARAASILSNSATVTPLEAGKVSSLLRSAAFLNPDRQVEILRGQLAAARGDKARATAIYLAVTRAEPRNLAAWDQLASINYGPAFARIAELEPPVH